MGDLPEHVEPGALGTGPWRWLVVWGVFGRPNATTLSVEAFDVDEALVIAHHQRPDLPPPRVGFLATQAP
jgi:hypothetical protein